MSNQENIPINSQDSVFENFSKSYYISELYDNDGMIYSTLFSGLQFQEELTLPFTVYYLVLGDNDDLIDKLLIGSELHLKINTLNTDQVYMEKDLRILSKEISQTQPFATEGKVQLLLCVDSELYDLIKEDSGKSKKYSNTTVKDLIESYFSDHNLSVNVDENLGNLKIDTYYMYGNFFDAVGRLVEKFPIYFYHDKYGIYQFHLFKSIIDYDGEYEELQYISQGATLQNSLQTDGEIIDNYFTFMQEFPVDNYMKDFLGGSKFETKYFQKSDGSLGTFDYYNQSVYKNLLNPDYQYKMGTLFDNTIKMTIPKNTILNENNSNIDFNEQFNNQLYQNIWPVERSFHVSHFEDLLDHIQIVYPNNKLIQYFDGNPNDVLINIRGFVGSIKHSFRITEDGGNSLKYIGEIHFYSNS